MSDQQKTPEELREEIADTRENLGETVEQLAAKTDVKARLHDEVEHRKQAAREGVKSKPQIPAAAAGAVVLLVALVVLKRRRS
jgi:ABC-type transporter Mla subunit MlaD